MIRGQRAWCLGRAVFPAGGLAAAIYKHTWLFSVLAPGGERRVGSLEILLLKC